MELKAGCGRDSLGGFLPRCCYCWNIGLPIFSFAPFFLLSPLPLFSLVHPFSRRRRVAANAVLTAPFICRMQIECNRRCGARHCCLARWWVEWTAGKTTRDDRHTGPITRVHTVDCGFVARCKKKRGFARDTAQARKFFISRGLKGMHHCPICIFILQRDYFVCHCCWCWNQC